ncbi:MAG: LysR family transcriptional regulator [Solirubrobacteraceae bacterium]
MFTVDHHHQVAGFGVSSGGSIRTPVRDIEVSELRAFCAAAALGSIAQAARSMHVSQPAMSKRLRAIEAVAGADLLRRSPRGVTLTPAGAELYRVARRLLRTADSVQALIGSPGPAVPVRIASSPTVAELRLPGVLSELVARDPRIAAELVSANSAFARELVSEGRAELGIVALDPYALHADSLEEHPVWRDEMVVAVPGTHPWRDLEEIPADEFAATAVLQRDPWSSSSRVVAAALDRLGLERTPPLPVIGSLAALVARSNATGAPALVSMLAARDASELQIELRRVEGVRFGIEYGLVWSGSMHDLRPEVQIVANHILALPFARVTLR